MKYKINFEKVGVVWHIMPGTATGGFLPHGTDLPPTTHLQSLYCKLTTIETSTVQYRYSPRFFNCHRQFEISKFKNDKLYLQPPVHLFSRNLRKHSFRFSETLTEK